LFFFLLGESIRLSHITAWAMSMFWGERNVGNSWGLFTIGRLLSTRGSPLSIASLLAVFCVVELFIDFIVVIFSGPEILKCGCNFL